MAGTSTHPAGGSRVFDLQTRLLQYAAKVICLVETMSNSRAGNHVVGQLLRCGTSPLSNHAEAQSAESPDDFIHKMSVCLKELRESHRWLLLVKMVPLVKASAPAAELIAETEELIRIFHASIRTARTRRNSRQRGESESKT